MELPNIFNSKVTLDILSKLDAEQLIDLLQYKTQLLLGARTVRTPDKQSILSLQSEVEIIQEEVKKRMKKPS